MTRNAKMLLWGVAAVGAFMLWKKRQASLVPVAVAAGTPSTAVSPTAAPTTANMQALAGYVNPTMDTALHGGYGSYSVGYPGTAGSSIHRLISGR